MSRFLISTSLAGAAAACVLPTNVLSNTITAPFAILIQNPAVPQVHNHHMNLDPAGGGDQHLFLNPVGLPHSDLTLQAGAIKFGGIHAVIGGEVRSQKVGLWTQQIMFDKV